MAALDPTCESDVPWLDYEVALDLAAESTLTMTWVDPEALGRDITITDLPVGGRLLWPGAELDADDHPIDWPGWKPEGDVWVEDDTDAWVRGPVTVRIDLNGAETDVVAMYPAATDDCDPEPGSGVQAGTGGPTPGASALDSGTGAAGATPPATSTDDRNSLTGFDGWSAALSLLAVIFAVSLAAADRARSRRRGR